MRMRSKYLCCNHSNYLFTTIMTTFVYRLANNHSNSFSNIGKKAVKKKEQRERRRRLKERTEKKNKVDKMVGLLKVEEADMEKVLLNRDAMTK